MQTARMGCSKYRSSSRSRGRLPTATKQHPLLDYLSCSFRINRGAELRGTDGISTGGRFVPARDFVEALDDAANNADVTKAVTGGSSEPPPQHDSAPAHDRRAA